MMGSLEHVLYEIHRSRQLPLMVNRRVRERLVLSLEALLAEKDAPKLFFDFLLYNGDLRGRENESESDDEAERDLEPERGYDHERDDERDLRLSRVDSLDSLDSLDRASLNFEWIAERRPNYVHNILWLSENCCISNSSMLHERNRTLDLLFALQIDNPELREKRSYICMDSSRAPTIASVTTEVDAILMLLSKHKKIQRICLHRADSRLREPLPVSLQALETFVRCRKPRTLDFGRLPLSTEQWRMIMFHCSENVTLVFGGHDWVNNGGDALTQAMVQNRCPTRIKFLDCGAQLNETNFQSFLAALEATTSLVELTFYPQEYNAYYMWSFHFGGERLALLPVLGALSRNRGLQKLVVMGSVTGRRRRFSEYEWDFFWSAFASHPTLKTLHPLSLESRSEASDQIMIRSVSNNTVLCNLHFDLCAHNRRVVAKQVRPVLRLNRFRPVVQAIKQEKDTALRERLFITALLSDQIHRYDLAFRFFLFRENPDLLVQFSSIDDVLLQQGNQAKRKRSSSY